MYVSIIVDCPKEIGDCKSVFYGIISPISGEVVFTTNSVEQLYAMLDVLNKEFQKTKVTVNKEFYYEE